VKSASLHELRIAVGPFPWRTADIAATSGKAISEEMTHWLALVIFAGFEVGVKRVDRDPHLVGTFNKIDRSKQYTRADAAELLRSLNLAWTRIRQLEELNLKKDLEIGVLKRKVRNYRIANTALISIITGLAWEGLRFVLPIAARWLGLS